MLEKIYLHLLILCGILCHGIIVTLSDEVTRDSSDFLVRKRRVISHMPGGSATTPIEAAKYIVKLKSDGRFHCTGAILSHYIIITAALCIVDSVTRYQVLSGAADDRNTDKHTLQSKLSYFGNLPHEEYDGIALGTVQPPFVYSSKTGNIQLYTGPLPAGTPAIVSGWGTAYPPNPIPGIQKRLRSIVLPIMNHEVCQTIYRGRFNITDKHLCTYDQCKHCAQRDAGTPLVVNNRMVGIHVWKGEHKNERNPDVFVNVQRADYSEWIREHTMLL